MVMNLNIYFFTIVITWLNFKSVPNYFQCLLHICLNLIVFCLSCHVHLFCFKCVLGYEINFNFWFKFQKQKQDEIKLENKLNKPLKIPAPSRVKPWTAVSSVSSGSSDKPSSAVIRSKSCLIQSMVLHYNFFSLNRYTCKCTIPLFIYLCIYNFIFLVRIFLFLPQMQITP